MGVSWNFPTYTQSPLNDDRRQGEGNARPEQLKNNKAGDDGKVEDDYDEEEEEEQFWGYKERELGVDLITCGGQAVEDDFSSADVTVMMG